MSPEAVEALEESLWNQSPGGQVPVLLPEDLPAPDGIMLLSNPIRVGAADSAPTAPRRVTRGIPKHRRFRGGSDTALKMMVLH